MVDFVRELTEKTELPQKQVVAGLGIARGKFYDGKKRYGKINEHNGWIPRDHWLEAEECQAILDFHDRDPLEGYRRMTS